MPWREKQCDEAGDCRLWRVTSVEYVRQSGGWETNGTRVSRGGTVCMDRQALLGNQRVRKTPEDCAYAAGFFHA